MVHIVRTAIMTVSDAGRTARRHKNGKALLAPPGVADASFSATRSVTRSKIYQTLPGWHSPLSQASSSERLLSTSSHDRPPPPLTMERPSKVESSSRSRRRLCWRRWPGSSFAARECRFGFGGPTDCHEPPLGK